MVLASWRLHFVFHGLNRWGDGVHRARHGDHGFGQDPRLCFDLREALFVKRRLIGRRAEVVCESVCNCMGVCKGAKLGLGVIDIDLLSQDLP